MMGTWTFALTLNVDILKVSRSVAILVVAMDTTCNQGCRKRE